MTVVHRDVIKTAAHRVVTGLGRKDKTFVAGGAAGKLLLNKKGWLGHAEVVLHKGEGPVSAIAWRCDARESPRVLALGE